MLGIVGKIPLSAQASRDRAVEINATVQESPPRIDLVWNSSSFPIIEQKIYRRLDDQSPWSLLATLADSATTFTDSSVSLGKAYEYWIYRVFSDLPSTACGYIRAGIRAPLVADRGKLILLVDDTMAGPLASEITQWIADLTGDGWTVVRQDVPRTATPPAIRSIVQNLHAADPASTRTLIFFGHLPVAYSGDFAADGHFEHYGAWPADVYYADVDGTWTDTTIDDDGGMYVNQNLPGDGKFDQSVLPSDVDLQMGRIDLSNLPAFSLSETELLRQYLNRNHAYRFKLGDFSNVPRRALVDDNFGFFYGDSFATDAWRSFAPICGIGNTFEVDWFDTLQTESYLWAYGCGGGSSDRAFWVGSTEDFATKDSRAVFNLLFGSWFGDWNQENNFLRAPLAGTTGSFGLVSCFASRPRWVFHPMAMGESIGYCTKLTQNNIYRTLHGYDSNNTERYVLSALQGDPTLRLYPVSPPSGLGVVPSGNSVVLNWSAAVDSSIEGYVISRASGSGGAYVTLNGAPITGTSFMDRTVSPSSSYSYMVRTVKLETSPSGTFLNPSQGIFSPTITAGSTNTGEIDVSGAGNSIVSGETVPMRSKDTDFGEATLNQPGVSRNYTIFNSGSDSLTLSTPQIHGTDGADFSITEAPATTLAPGTGTNLEILFTPSAQGRRSATVTFANSDPDETNYHFEIGGDGVSGSAEIANHPPNVSRSIHPDALAGADLLISNPGSSQLVHQLTTPLSDYTYRDSNSPGGPDYDWEEISVTGTPLTWTYVDEDLSNPLPLGFDFPFYGNPHQSVRVGINGFVTFTGKIAYGANSVLPNLSCSENIIAAFWNDIFLDSNCNIFYQNVGVNFVIQYDNVPLYGNANTRITCQIILKPSGEILLQYKAINQTGNNYTIGIQNGTRDKALLIAYNSPYVQPLLAIRILPPKPNPWLSLGATSGTIVPNGVQSVPLTLNSAGLEPGDYSTEVLIQSDDSRVTSRIIPVHLRVGNTPVEDWRQLNFQNIAGSGSAADLEDPDKDGKVNLLEYAFASSPLTSDSPSSVPTIIDGAGYLQVQFNRHQGRTDLRYHVEVTDDLQATWTRIASSVHGAPTLALGAYSVSETGGGDIRTVTVQDSSPVASFPRRFVRLSVIRD